MKLPCFLHMRKQRRRSAAFGFATLSFLNPEFQASSHLLWLYSPVCVGPSRKLDTEYLIKKEENYNILHLHEFTGVPLFNINCSSVKYNSSSSLQEAVITTHARFRQTSHSRSEK